MVKPWGTGKTPPNDAVMNDPEDTEKLHLHKDIGVNRLGRPKTISFAFGAN